ncbi:MAG: hypothetical protein Kow0060_18550 [Methylohalobius crimeensis]
MVSRLLAIAKSKTFIIAVVLLIAYALAGFFLLPYWVKHYLPRYAQEQLQRQASIGDVYFNPFLFKFEAKDFEFTEADGRPILGFQRLWIDFELLGVFRWAWTFKEIALDQPSLLVYIGPAGEVNLAALARSFPRAEETEKEPDESAPPRLLIQHMEMNQGRVTLRDESDPTHAKATTESIDLALNDISTLPEREGGYALQADLPDGGGELIWQGDVSLQPLKSSGRFELLGRHPVVAWRFFQDELNLAQPQGTFDVRTNYRVAFDRGLSQLLLEDLSIAIQGAVLRLRDESEPMLRLESLSLGDGRVDIPAQQATFGTLAIGPGKVRVALDASGLLNWQRIVRAKPNPKPAESSSSPPPAQPWKISLASIRLADLGLEYEDATRKAPMQLEVGAIGTTFGLALETEAAGVTGALTDGQLNLERIRLSQRGGEAPLATLDRLGVAGIRADLGQRALEVERVQLQGGGIQAAREKGGRIPLLDLVTSAKSGEPQKDEPKSAPKTQANPWSWALNTLQLEGFTTALADRSLEPAPAIDIVADKIALKHLSGNGKTPTEFEAALTFKQGGTLNVNGQLAPNFDKVDAQLKLSQLSLSPFAAYVTHFTTLKLVGGDLSTQGRLAYSQKAESKPGIGYTGALSVNGLRLNEADTGQRFLAWQALSANRIDFGLMPGHLDIAEVRLTRPESKIVIYKDKRVNLAEILKDKGEDGAAGKKAAKAPPSEGSADSEASPFPVNVGRVRIDKGEVDFADLSLVFPFSAHIEDFTGVAKGISSKPASKTRLLMEGQVAPYGLARVYGVLKPFRPKDLTDISVEFTNIEIPPFTPYSATFVGRKITSGTLDLNLDYQIENSQLVGENEVILRDFTLGERVEAPQAKNLPLDLAIALLKDSQGVIHLAVPVSGDTDDPQFSYGKVIWGAFVNVIVKAATSPFRALGSMLGGEGELDRILAFEPGRARLLPPEREKLDILAQALEKRPQLKIVVQGRFDEQLDGKALRQRRVRRALAKEMEVELAPGDIPGPVSFEDAKNQIALENLLKSRAGKDAVDEFEAAYKESTGAEKVDRVNRLLAVFGGASEDTAFYQALFDRLVALESLPKDALVALARSRQETIVKALGETGLKPDQFAGGEAAPVEEQAEEIVEVPLSLAPLEAGG